MRSAPSHPTDPQTAEAQAALSSLGRETHARVLAMVARRFGDIDLAEDATQEAYARALVAWSSAGVPDSPEAWLKVTAKNVALDLLRREATLLRKLPELTTQAQIAQQTPVLSSVDDRLSLLFACAHPALSAADQVALTLRYVAGISTADIAHALFITVPTLQQRIVRAKQRIRKQAITFAAPDESDLRSRIAVVLKAIYLIFAAGYTCSSGSKHTSVELTTEALSLSKLLHSAYPGAETKGLLALLTLLVAKGDSRTDESGQPVPLQRQDRTLWDRHMIQEGITLAEQASAMPGAGVYTMQAAIAALHAESESFETTDWHQITLLYAMLIEHDPRSPLLRLGYVIAKGRWRGLRDGLALLNELEGDPEISKLREYHFARAVTCKELGLITDAKKHFQTVVKVPGNNAELSYLTAEISALLQALD